MNNRRRIAGGKSVQQTRAELVAREEQLETTRLVLVLRIRLFQRTHRDQDPVYAAEYNDMVQRLPNVVQDLTEVRMQLLQL